MTNQILQVQGMSCNHCVISIEGALNGIGVQGQVNLASNTVEVAYDENVMTIDKVKEVIEEQGYDVE